MAAAASSSSRADLWIRLAVTVLLPAVPLLALSIGLPGLDTSGLPPEQQSTSSFSAFALGILPFLTAAVLVEIVALVVPRWSGLRHGGPKGRAKLARATVLVGTVLAVSQAYGVAQLLAAMSRDADLGKVSTPILLLTLVAGAASLLLLAELASPRALTGGIAALVAGPPVYLEARRLAAQLGPAATTPPIGLLAVLFAIAAIACVTAWVLRSPQDAATGSARPRVEVPGPASGVIALSTGASLLLLPATLANLGLPMGHLPRLLTGDAISTPLAAIAAAIFTGAFAWLWNRPARLAALGARAVQGAPSTGELEAEARAALRPAMVRALVFVLALLALSTLSRVALRYALDATAIALFTAYALDAAAEWRARRANPDLVAVWPEHRPYAVPMARAALAEAGIPLHARNERVRRLLQFFGPFVPIELMVPREGAARASEILEALLLARKAATHTSAPLDAPAKAAPLDARLVVALGIVVAALVALTLAARPQSHPVTRSTQAPDALQIFALDDEHDLVAAEPAALPAGVSVQVENAPVGPGHTEARRYARIMRTSSESLELAGARFEAWLAPLAVPAGDRVLLGRVEEYNEEKDAFEIIGWRTYLLKGPPAINALDVAAATGELDRASVPQALVKIELTPAGGERFAALTRANLKRRLAIVAEGRVESAPIVQGEIAGGQVQITMGAGDPEHQLAEAKRLAARLRGE